MGYYEAGAIPGLGLNVSYLQGSGVIDVHDGENCLCHQYPQCPAQRLKPKNSIRYFEPLRILTTELLREQKLWRDCPGQWSSSWI